MIEKDVAVIGGGVIGLCAAERLSHEGYSVVIIEKNRIAAGASERNAAGFAFSEIMPMASAGTIRKSIKWFFDPTGPFSVVWRDLPQTAGWLLRFALAARRSNFERSMRCLAEQMQLEQQTLPQMLQRVELEPMVRASGALYLYPTRAALEADRDFWRMRGEHGTEHEILEGAALHDFQPGLSPGLYAGIYAPKYRAVTDPGDYCEALHAALAARPVETVYSMIDRLEPLSDGVIVHDREQALARVKHAVLAAGPWSGKLAAELGDRVPLIGERGYNTTFPKSAFEALDKTLFFTADGFVMAPLADGVRVGGASEIAGLERAPDFRRSRIMVQKARKLVPGLRQCEGDEWMGIRPTTPDTLPVIGYSRASKRIVYAFGHGHLGLTQATSTAQLVADLVANRPSAFNIDALSAERF